MIGQTVEFEGQGEYRIMDMVHGHYYLVRESDGYDRMARVAEVDRLLEERRKAIEMGDVYGELFRKRGFFVMNRHVANFAIGGRMGTWHSKYRGCSTHVIKAACSFNQYSGVLDFGAGGDSYYAHSEIELDPSKRCGMVVSQLDLDEVEWLPIESLLDTMMGMIEEQFDLAVPIKGLRVNVSPDSLGSFSDRGSIFWPANGDRVAYRISPDLVDRGFVHWQVLVGEVRSFPRGKQPGAWANFHGMSSVIALQEIVDGDALRSQILERCKQELQRSISKIIGGPGLDGGVTEMQDTPAETK